MIRVAQVDWADQQALICPIREAVFIQEQNVPVELEWDGLDAQCIQLLLLNDDEAVGTARMTVNGKIGRMAVLREHRGCGGGKLLLSKMIQIAREAQLTDVVLDAQVCAISFYKLSGFEVVSEVFMDAGIEHRKMRLLLAI
ncbi:MAG: GNAT family N-acetyltransferase [Gammaproteobacteria bacterium]|nr:GNAT family N-acetyltransferase [Gammaproteobacteria bacterium]